MFLIVLPKFLRKKWIFWNAIALFPFVILKYDYLKYDKILMNHEKIHLRQQIELLVLPFYILYIAHFFFNYLNFNNFYDSYKNIFFEKEAYSNDSNLNYLKNRKLWAAFQYLKK
ncbi:MAG: hypothetical protein OHK0038_20300 [Flammeovirgaceae bacterium]